MDNDDRFLRPDGMERQYSALENERDMIAAE